MRYFKKIKKAYKSNRFSRIGVVRRFDRMTEYYVNLLHGKDDIAFDMVGCDVGLNMLQKFGVENDDI